MKSRIIWAAVLLTAIAGFYFVTIRPTQYSSPGFSRKHPPFSNLRPPDVAPPPLPTPVYEMPTLTPPTLPTPSISPPSRPLVRRNPAASVQMEVPIQNGTTIDFSNGGIPIIRSQSKDQEAIDRAMKEIAEATKDTVFEPTKK